MTGPDADVPLANNAPDPLWAQVESLIRRRIESGDLHEGDRLPAERELCLQLEISRVTLRKALRKLVDDGILESSHGRGWFVASKTGSPREWSDELESFTETAARLGLKPSSRVLTLKKTGANFDQGELLSIAPGTPVILLRRLRFFDSVPIAVEESVVPASVLPGFDSIDFSVASLFHELALAGNGPESSEATLQARSADGELAEMLELEVGDPILEMRQTTFGSGGRAIAISYIRYAGDRYRMRTGFSRNRGS